MKPSDHPEFFRLPPPPGRSRESSIVLDASGRFWHEGALVVHPGVARAFASWVDRHPDDGRYILNNGYDWSYFTVEDAPLLVTHVTGIEAGWPLLELSSGESVKMDPASVWVGARDALYSQVRLGPRAELFDAKFTPAAQLALTPFLEELAGGEIGIRCGTTVFPIKKLPLPG